MDAKRERGCERFSRWWIALLVVLIGLPIGLVTAQQAGVNQQSPATGHAQVTTQGISDLPSGQVVWRVVERTAKTRDTATSGRRVTGFILATEEPVLLTNLTVSGKKEDVARLAPGESFMVKNGTEQIRSSLSDHDVKYIAIELVPEDQVDNVGGGKLLYKSDPFDAPSGERDLDLVRNVLISGETATMPDTGGNVVILATEGAIDITPASGKRTTLETGNGQIFRPGDLTIAAGTPSANTGSVRAQFAMMTSSLQQGNGSRAAYVVAVIGPEIPPANASTQPTVQPAATQETQSQPQPQPTDVPEQPTAESEPTDVPVATGAISAQVFNCPEGMTLDNLSPDQCEGAGRGIGLQLDGPDGTKTLDDAQFGDGTWTWSPLSFGTWLLTETSLPKGYDTYFVPGSDAVGGSPNGGFTIGIADSAPEITVQVYNLAAPPVTGSITVNLFLCPEGSSSDDFDPASCAAADGGYSISATAASTGTQLSMNDAQVSGGSVTWTDLPLDSYMVTVDALPDPWAGVLWPDGSATRVGSGETFTISGDSRDVNLVLYAFQPKSVIIQ